MSAILKTKRKLKIKDRYVIEYTLYELPRSEKYPDGVKYGLICKDITNGNTVLFDNHHPKGPHIHIGNREIQYTFLNEERLIEDFNLLVLERMGIQL